MTPYWHHKVHMEQNNTITTQPQPLAMAPISKRQKTSPVIIAVSAPILLAVAPAPVPLIAVPVHVLLHPAPAPVPVVVGMVPPPHPFLSFQHWQESATSGRAANSGGGDRAHPSAQHSHQDRWDEDELPGPFMRDLSQPVG